MADYNQTPTGVPSRALSYSVMASGSNSTAGTLSPFYSAAGTTDFFSSKTTFLDKDFPVIVPSWRRNIKNIKG